MTTIHQHSIFVDAPVETVFRFVADPERFYSALASKMVIESPGINPDQVGGIFRWSVPYVGGITERGEMRRLEYVENKRILDRSSRGWVWTVLTESVADGTRLTFKAEESSTVPLLDKLDAAVFRVDHQVQKTLTKLKKRIEAAEETKSA